MDQLIIGLAVTIIRILADQNAALRQANPEEGVNRGLLGALFGLVVARPGTFVMRPIRIVGRGLGWLFGWRTDAVPEEQPIQNVADIPCFQIIPDHQTLVEYANYINREENRGLLNNAVYVMVMSQGLYRIVRYVINTGGTLIIIYIVYRVGKRVVRRLIFWFRNELRNSDPPKSLPSEITGRPRQ